MKDDETKVTISSGGQTASTTLGKLKATAERATGTIRRVEDLLEIHNDTETTRELNKDFDRLRQEIDTRAREDEKSVKGSMTITIHYQTEGATGMHEIEIVHAIKPPKRRSNKRKMYEDAQGNLTDRKPTKQTEMFDNVRPIKAV